MTEYQTCKSQYQNEDYTKVHDGEGFVPVTHGKPLTQRLCLNRRQDSWRKQFPSEHNDDK